MTKYIILETISLLTICIIKPGVTLWKTVCPRVLQTNYFSIMILTELLKSVMIYQRLVLNFNKQIIPKLVQIVIINNKHYIHVCNIVHTQKIRISMLQLTCLAYKNIFSY